MTAAALHALSDADLAKVAAMVRNWSLLVAAEQTARAVAKK